MSPDCGLDERTTNTPACYEIVALTTCILRRSDEDFNGISHSDEESPPVSSGGENVILMPVPVRSEVTPSKTTMKKLQASIKSYPLLIIMKEEGTVFCMGRGQ